MLSVDAVYEQVMSYGSRHVVLTGGEPMVAAQLPPLARRLSMAGCHVTIETAATVLPGEIPCDLASLSPKLASSTPDVEVDSAWAARHEAQRWRPQIVAQWIRQYDWQLKFVVSRPEDLVEVHGMITQLEEELGHALPADQILLMPEGKTSEELRLRQQWLVEVCKANGFRLCHRLHVELFGNKRGT